jgi:hypothetical protein
MRAGRLVWDPSSLEKVHPEEEQPDQDPDFSGRPAVWGPQSLKPHFCVPDQGADIRKAPGRILSER